MPCLIQTIFFSLSQPKKTDDLIQPIFFFLPQPKKTDDLIQPIFFSLSQPKKTDDLIQPIFFSLSQPKKTGDEEEAHHRRNTFIKHPLQGMEVVSIMFYWGGKILSNRDEGVSYDIEPQGLYNVYRGITLSELEAMMVPKVGTHGEIMRLEFKCRLPCRGQYRLLPIKDNETLSNVLDLPHKLGPDYFLEIYVEKERNFGSTGMPFPVGGTFTQMLTQLQSPDNTLTQSAHMFPADNPLFNHSQSYNELNASQNVDGYYSAGAGPSAPTTYNPMVLTTPYPHWNEQCPPYKDRELGDAHAEIKALKYSKRVKEKAVEELTDELNKVDEKLKATEALLESKNLEIKKINDEKKAALAAQFAAEATLRRVHAAQKDDEMPPIEAIITPLEAELKLARLEIDNVGMDTVMFLGGSSRQQRNQKVWLLPPFTYDYKSEKYSSPKDYYAGIRAEWAFRVTEQEGLFNDLRNFGAPIPHRRSLTMARRNVSDYEKAVSRIKKENNRMLMRRCRHFMLQLATEMAEASNRDLTDSQFRNHSHGNSEFTDLPYSERALILSVYADGLSSHVTWCTGSGSRRGGRNLQRGESSRRGGGRGSGDAEDEPPFPLLDASYAYHDRFGKRHFVMPKYYRDPCGLVEDPSENQTGYGYAKARLLKWFALFIERVQNERLCRERRLKVPKARSVEIQKEDPDNVDRLCQTLQREISQMGRRLARDMQLLILKKDAQKNRTEPNVAAIKGIREDPELVSDAELSDCSDSEPPADLSAN
ncbi:unnamed protein product [Camellia sinensis]